MKKFIAILIALTFVFTLTPFAGAAAADDAPDDLKVLQFDKEPEMDGKVTEAEWGTPTRANIKYPDNVWTDIDDDSDTSLEFTFWLRYTFKGFYIAFQTPDTSNFNQYVDNASIWNGDCLQMRIDEYGCTVDQGLDPTATRDGNYSADYQEFAFALGGNGSGEEGECYSYCWHGIMEGESLGSSNGKYTASNDGKTTTYELYIPWEDLVESNPHVGTSYGYAICMLTATDGDYENWLEWGTGVVNGRDDNIKGTNRITFVADTVFGGSSLTDPNPVSEVTTKAPVADATGAYAPFDFSKLSNANMMSYTANDDGSVTFKVEEGADPYITVSISSQTKIDAETYPYLGLYLKNSDACTSGEIFFVTSDSGISDFSGGYSIPFDYQDVTGGQVVVVDFTESYDWLGTINKLRFDIYNGGASDYETAEVTVFAAAFFKTEAEAYAFAVDGVTLDLDPAYEPYVPDADTTAAPVNETTAAPAEDSTAAPETSVSTDANTSKTEVTTGTTGNTSGNNGWIIWVVIGVIAVAAVVVIVIIATKKKKK